MKEELFKGLSEEQMAKLKDCNNVEELLALAKQEVGVYWLIYVNNYFPDFV